MRWGRWAGALLATAILAADVTPAARHALPLPARVTVAADQTQLIRLDLPGRLGVRALGPAGHLLVDGAPTGPTWRSLPGAALELQPGQPGLYRLGLRLFGVLPWRSLQVQAVPVPEVAPGGQSVGIVLQALGPLVVRQVDVPGPDGPRTSPAAAAGMRVGDYVLAVDGAPVHTALAVQDAVQASRGAPVRLSLLRGGHPLAISVRPAWDAATGTYLLGAWVRDEASGIGTLTFSSSERAVWGALGHPVTDPTTGHAVALRSGWLLRSVIAGLEPSRDGHPGEKEGVLVGGQAPLGAVTANTAVGVFGRFTPGPPPRAGTLPIALQDQVHVGAARMLTVLHGAVVGSFAVRITAVLPQRRASSKGLVLTVTDPRLLRETGGIVQGMSGSPLLQDGRLIGAVTHVLVDDPSRGYGVLAEWMAAQAGLLGPGRAV